MLSLAKYIDISIIPEFIRVIRFNPRVWDLILIILISIIVVNRWDMVILYFMLLLYIRYIRLPIAIIFSNIISVLSFASTRIRGLMD